ncbi:MAG: hypothetical protein ACOYVD_02760 [Bacillota bacterium]
MSRYRKISPIDSRQQEMLIETKSATPKSTANRPVRKTPRPRPISPLASLKASLQRSLNNRSPQELVCETCSGLRGVCNHVRSFANDVDNLLNSIEALAPILDSVLAGYALTKKGNDTALEKKTTPKSAETIYEEAKNNQNLTRKDKEESPPPATPFNKVPSEEELKNFLNNPLVSTLLHTVTQKMMTQQK